MSDETDDLWRRFQDATEILNADQYARRDVLEVVGLTDAQLKNTLDRNLVRLASEHNPGTGRRRMFTGSDILKIATAHTMSAIGFPMRWSYLLAEEVARRASGRLMGIDLTPGLSIVTFPRPDGDWERVPVWEGMPEEPRLPAAVQILQVDQLTDEILAKLRALVEEQPLPSFDVPLSQPEPSPYSPESDFFMQWATDAEGRRILVGLTFEETQEHEALNQKFWKNRTEDNYFPWADVSERRRDLSRNVELENKHEAARIARLGATFAERSKDK